MPLIKTPDIAENHVNFKAPVVNKKVEFSKKEVSFPAPPANLNLNLKKPNEIIK